MNRNSAAKSKPASKPALNEPSGMKSGIPRTRAQTISSGTARADRMPACITRETPGAASFAAT